MTVLPSISKQEGSITIDGLTETQLNLLRDCVANMMGQHRHSNTIDKRELSQLFFAIDKDLPAKYDTYDFLNRSIKRRPKFGIPVHRRK